MDVEIVGSLCGSTGEVRFEGKDEAELVEKAVNWLGENRVAVEGKEVYFTSSDDRDGRNESGRDRYD